MKAVLRLEIIGDNYYAYQRAVANGDCQAAKKNERYGEMLGHDKTRPWVACITGPHPKYGLAREFLHGQKDYSLANSIGSRGVYEYFALDPGIYEIHERLTWKKTRRYFIQVKGTEISEIDKEEVLECLKSVS